MTGSFNKQDFRSSLNMFKFTGGSVPAELGEMDGRNAAAATVGLVNGEYMQINPLLHWLFLDHDIIFLFLDKIEKIQEKFKLSFEYCLKIIWKMEHLLQKSKCSIFYNIFKYMIFQRCQKVLLWSEVLNKINSEKLEISPSNATF